MRRLISVAIAREFRSRCVFLALLLCTLLVVPVRAAFADSDSWSVIPGTATVSNAQLGSTYCFPGTSQCIAVGSFGSSPVIETNASGAWQAVPGDSPPSGTFYASGLNSVSCVSVSFCVAVGDDQPLTNSGNQQPFVAMFNGTSWSFQQLTVTGPSPDYVLSSVSCASTTSCIAVGSGDEGYNSLIIESFNGTGWTATLQTGKSVYPTYYTAYSGVSCIDAADCVAVGFYASDANEDIQGFAEVLSGGTWTYSAAPVLTGSNALFAVDCLASGCIAVGDQNGQGNALIEDYANGVWSVVAGSGTSGNLRSVSCPATGYCAAVGSDSAHRQVVMTSLAGTWSQQPAPSPISETFGFTGVSCASETFCVAPGWGIFDDTGEGGYGENWLMSGGILRAPGAPTGLVATPSPGATTLSWSAPASDGGSPITGYDVFQGTGSGAEDASPVNQTPITGTSFTVTGLGAGPAYFTVEAVNSIGLSAPSNEVLTSSSSTTLAAAPPTSAVTGQQVTFTATVTSGTQNAGPPTGTVTFALDGSTQPAAPLTDGTANLTISSLTPGAHTITAAYSGDGTFGGSSATPLSYTVTQAATTVALTPTANPSRLDQSTIVTATVAPVYPGAGTPTGTVTFTVDGTAQAPQMLTVGSATLDITALAAGSHSITAAYAGDSDFSASSATLTQTVQASASVTLTSSVSPSVYGQPAVITTVVSPIAPESATPTGSVTFSIDGTTSAPVSLVNGMATDSLASLSPGSHTVTAAYSGDSVFAATSSTFTQTVNQAGTTTSLSSSANPADAGQTVTITAACAPSAPGSGTPTGSVVFTVNGVPQPAIALSQGTATLSLNGLAPGTYTITAQYSGDADFTTSSSATLNQSVQQQTTTTIAASPASGSVHGTTVTLTATETPATSGSVQFYDGTSPLGSPVGVSSGTAAYPTSALSVGTHSLSATFTPSAPGYVLSSSAALPYQVSAPALSIDQTVTKNGTGTVTTSSFSTTGPRLLVAFVSSDGPATKQTATVSGAGLPWTLVQRADTKGGTAEIWTATASAPLTGTTVTSTQKTSGYDQSLTVIAFSGAGGIGASASAGKAKAAPAVTLTTTAPGSWVFGVGEDYTNAIARTPANGQSIVKQWIDTTPGETFWVQNETTTTPAAGTTVTLADTAPTNDTWNFAAAEILAASS